MVEYAAALSLESIVDVEDIVSIPEASIEGTRQQVIFRVSILWCFEFVL
jgi:aspartyl-tRNA synthetase